MAPDYDAMTADTAVYPGSIATLVAVDSSNLSHVGHDGSNLYVRFGSGIYRHEGVPPELHQALMDADSKGAFYHQNIKGRFPTTKVPDAKDFHPWPNAIKAV